MTGAIDAGGRPGDGRNSGGSGRDVVALQMDCSRPSLGGTGSLECR